MTARRILVAGIGNIFHGDDAFGVEVIRRLVPDDWPEGVRVTDFGIRSYDLAYAIMDGYAVTILVDATQQGWPPGTVYLIEPDLSELGAMDGAVVNGHSLNPLLVLRLVRALSGELGRLYVVGCEPAALETEGGSPSLSAVVQAAVPIAAEMVRSLVTDLLREPSPPHRGIPRITRGHSMDSYFKKVLAAVPLVFFGAAVALNVPGIRRYARIRMDSRDEKPMGVATTSRSYVLGRPAPASPAFQPGPPGPAR